MTDQNLALLAETLANIRENMMALVDSAEEVMQIVGGTDEARARAYWIAHIKSALGGYGYTAMCSMSDSVSDLYAEATNEEVA